MYVKIQQQRLTNQNIANPLPAKYDHETWTKVQLR